MSEKISYQVKLQGSDGKEYVISYKGLKQNLDELENFEEKTGWNTVTRMLRDDVNCLEKVVIYEVLVPKAKDAILEFLKDHPNVKTRDFQLRAWLESPKNTAWYIAKQELEEEGAIVSASQGRGRNRTWSLKGSDGC